MTKSVCGGVRSSTLDSLGMSYHKKRKMKKIHENTFFLEKKSGDIFQKNERHFFRKSYFSIENWLLRKSDFLKIFVFLKNVIGLFFKKKNLFSWKFSFFLFLWYLIPKLSNVELLTPPHTLLVMVYVSDIFSKIRKIPKIRKSVLAVLRFSSIK